MRDFEFLKKFGQNFLRDSESIIDVIATLDPKKKDRVLEIGPGAGALTEYITENVEYIKAIEIDTRLIEYLKERFAHIANMKVINTDIMQLDIEKEVEAERINKIIGALPYNISKQIISRFCGDYHLVYDRCVFILQKEVAHAYAATGKKGTFLNHFYSILNRIEVVKDLEKSKFVPVPQVDSSIILFEPIPRAKVILSEQELQKYATFLKNCFLNPRKQLLKNLKNIYRNKNWMEIFNLLGISSTTRAEELSREEILKLFRKFSSEN